MPRTRASVKPWRMLKVAMEPGVDLGAGVAIVRLLFRFYSRGAGELQLGLLPRWVFVVQQ